MKRLIILTALLACAAGCSRGGDNDAANELSAKEADVKSGMDNKAGPAAVPWQTLPNGLRYRRTAGPGNGRKPTPESTVTLHYTGTLQDGTVFDSSLNSGAPITMSLPTLIPAWQQAVPLMGEGDVFELVVPPELGYGAEGQGPIPPNATLYFEIGLLRVES